MRAPFQKKIVNTFEDLSTGMDDCRTFLEDAEVPDEVIFAITLALEEMISNTIKYGYEDQHAHVIEVEVRIADRCVEIEIRDDGHPFDPFSQEEPDTSLPPEERPIGGLGIHLVKNMLDSCAYAREDGRNIVRVAKAWQHSENS